jgi:hypothetical protein
VPTSDKATSRGGTLAFDQNKIITGMGTVDYGVGGNSMETKGKGGMAPKWG